MGKSSNIRSIDSTWDEDDDISFLDQEEGGVFLDKKTVVFYVNGNKKKFTCYNPKIYRGLGLTQITTYCIRLGEIFQNGEIVIPENEFSTTIKAKFIDGLLHSETTWALKTEYTQKNGNSPNSYDMQNQDMQVKKEWYYRGKKHSYNDRPAVLYPNFTLTWYDFTCEIPYRLKKPCVIYPPAINGDEVLISIGFNEDKEKKTGALHTTQYIKPEELTKYEPNYFDYIKPEKLKNYIQYLDTIKT